MLHKDLQNGKCDGNDRDVATEITDRTIMSLDANRTLENWENEAWTCEGSCVKAGTANLVKMSGGAQGCVLFLYVSTCFLVPVCWQNRPRAPAPAQLSWHQRSGSTITGTHTLSSSQSFAPMGTKAQCGETERGDDNPQWGKSKVLGVVGKSRGGD